MVVAGGLARTEFFRPEPLLDAAAWNPATDQWRRLPDLPSTRRGATLAVVGDVIYVLGGLSLSEPVAEVVALLPGASAWEPRATVGPSPTAGYVAAGDTIVAVRSDHESAGAARYDVAHDRWVPLDAPPWAPGSAAGLVWTGREVVVLAGAGPFLDPPPGAPDGVALDPRTGRWRALSRAPVPGFAARTSMAVVWTGTAVLAWGGEVAHGLGSAVTSDGVLYAPAR